MDRRGDFGQSGVTECPGLPTRDGKHHPSLETSWTIIECAAGGNAEAREHFAELYAPALKAYFCKRWERTPYIASVDDAVQDVFVDCFKSDGVLSRTILSPGLTLR